MTPEVTTASALGNSSGRQLKTASETLRALWILGAASDGLSVEHPDLNFIVEHCGLPRLEDFCWIAVQEPNVYAGLAVAIPFLYSRPRYFAQMIGEMLFWLDENRILFASDYAIWHPKWIVEQFVDPPASRSRSRPAPPPEGV